MRNTLSSAIVFSVLFINVLSAEIITVDNKYPYVGDYQTLQAAHDAASPGDIIYVSPSLVPYSAITVTKQLTFYGVGFDITEISGEPMTTSASIRSGYMQFQDGSAGSRLEGFDGPFGIRLYTNNITIKKNNLYTIFIEAGGSGCTIIQNKIINENSAAYISINGASNILISNNIIINEYSGPGATRASISGGIDLIISNNVLRAISGQSLENINNSIVINNIIIAGGIGGSNNIVNYNIFPFALSIGTGNLENVDMSTVFVDHENYDFHLLPNSPAMGAGESGTDMGIYGGDLPYIDGGFPGLPSILQIQAPNVGSQQSGLDISFKAKSNKQ